MMRAISKGLPLNYLRVLRKLIKWSLAAFGAFILVVFIFRVLGIIPEDPASLMLARWKISEEKHNNLQIELLDHDKIPIIFDIKRHPENGLLESISVIKVYEAERGFVFTYEVKGKYGVPMGMYSFRKVGSGMAWYDFNFDGIFDQQVDTLNLRVKINLEGRWVRASGGKREMLTDEGIFIFDAVKGKWEPIDPNEPIL